MIAEMPVHTATIYFVERDEVVQYPYHLGTIESVARLCVKDLAPWATHRGRWESIALWYAGRVVDYWDGRAWSSDMTADWDQDSIEG